MGGNWLKVDSHDGLSFEAYVAAPSHGSGPGLVLCQEIFGVNAHMRELADRYAEEGYVVFVPDLFWRIERRVDLGYGAEDVTRAMAINQRLDDVLAVRDIGAAVAALRAHPAFRGRVGALGFCLGGRLCLLAAAQGLVDCVVSYYGVGLETRLDALGRVAVPAVLHFGGADTRTPPAAIEAIRAVFAGRDDVAIHVYPGAGHAFNSPQRPSYDASASGLAYSRTLARLRATLGPHYELFQLWDAHRACEFVTRDADATMATMVDQPYVNHVPTMTGGYGRRDLHRFYRDYFIPNNPPDMRNIPVSQTVGVDRVVNEGVLCFTHDREIPWLLPGVPPTGKYVEVALVGIITFRGGKLAHEHIYWDQASVLVQVGLLDADGLPVAGAQSARKVIQPSLPSNTLITDWNRDAAPGQDSD